MMGLYVYCVAPSGHSPRAALTGLNHGSVRAHHCAELNCWVSELPARPEPAINRIREHHTVVEQSITVQITPVPVRFGQWLDSANRLDHHLEEQADRYQALLETFAGALEFGLRLLDPARAPATPAAVERPATGQAYLQTLREKMHAHDLSEPQVAEVRRSVHDIFAGLTRAEQFEPLATQRGLLSVSHLVPRAGFDEYRARVDELRGRFANLRLLASGPWPPYSFAV
jgi:gas vesicle protein GvpL/GvpF